MSSYYFSPHIFLILKTLCKNTDKEWAKDKQRWLSYTPKITVSGIQIHISGLQRLHSKLLYSCEHTRANVQKVKAIFSDILKSSGFYSNFGFLHCQCFVLINMWLDPKSVFLLTLKSYFTDPSPLKLIPGTQPLSCVDLVGWHLPYMNTYYFHYQLSI